MSGDTFRESIYGIGSTDQIHLEGDRVTFAEGDSERTLQVILDVADEALTITLDAYHLRELRLAIQRAEKWVGGKDS
jgi:hypothetical protein